MDAMSMIKLTDKNGNDITAQQAYDAAMSGPVYAFMGDDGEGNLSIDVFLALDLYTVIRENGNIITTIFTGFSVEEATYRFYAGQNPNNIQGGGPKR